jgi:hypothetical protein
MLQDIGTGKDFFEHNSKSKGNKSKNREMGCGTKRSCKAEEMNRVKIQAME